MHVRTFQPRPVKPADRHCIPGTSLERPDALNDLFADPLLLLEFVRKEQCYTEFYPDGFHDWQRALSSNMPYIRALAAVILGWDRCDIQPLIASTCEEHERCYNSDEILWNLKTALWISHPGLRAVAASAIVRWFDSQDEAAHYNLWHLLDDPHLASRCIAAQSLLQTLDADSAKREKVLDTLYDCLASSETESRALAATILLREETFKPSFSVSSLIELIRDEMRADNERNWLRLLYPALEELQIWITRCRHYARCVMDLTLSLKSLYPDAFPDFSYRKFIEIFGDLLCDPPPFKPGDFREPLVIALTTPTRHGRSDRIWSLTEEPWFDQHVRSKIIVPTAANLKSKFRWPTELHVLVQDAEAKFLETVIQNYSLGLDDPEDDVKLADAFLRKARSTTQHYLRKTHGPITYRSPSEPSLASGSSVASPKWPTYYVRPISDLLSADDREGETDPLQSLASSPLTDPRMLLCLRDELNRIRRFLAVNAPELQRLIFEEYVSKNKCSCKEIERRLGISYHRVYYAKQKLFELFRENRTIHASLLFVLSNCSRRSKFRS